MALAALVLGSSASMAHAAEFRVTRTDDPAPNGCQTSDDIGAYER